MIKSIDFVLSSPSIDLAPKTDLPEFAFIGRSNVGKSSLINLLANKKIAKTSSTPGKTQLINFFIANDSWHLVDLPAYGYAKIAKTTRAKWMKKTKEFLVNREQLYCTFVLIDSRLSPQKNDIEFIQWLGENGVPFAIIFTKIDKNRKGETKKNITTFENKMLENWEELPQRFRTSSVSKEGKEGIIDFIEALI